MDLSVRDVSEDVFRQFKSAAKRQDLKIGDALTAAMESWLEEQQEKKDLTELKPEDWGDEGETSEEIDDILYGANA